MVLLSAFDTRLRTADAHGGLLAVRDAAKWCLCPTEVAPASTILALLAARFLHEMTCPVRPDGGGDDLALPARFRERCADDDAQARAFESFADERPLLYRCLRCCQPGFLRDFEAATDHIILELRAGQPAAARFQGEGQQRAVAVLRERASLDRPAGAGADSGGDDGVAEKCMEYVGCGLEGVADRLRASWLFAGGGGLLGVVPPLGEGGTLPLVPLPGGAPASDGGGEGGGLSPEWEALAVQGAREAALWAVGLCGLAAAEVLGGRAGRGRGEEVEEGLVWEVLLAAEGATWAVVQVQPRDGGSLNAPLLAPRRCYAAKSIDRLMSLAAPLLRSEKQQRTCVQQGDEPRID